MSKAQEAQQFLDDLDAFAPPKASGGGGNKSSSAAPPTTKPGEAAEALAFLDEITQKSAEPTPRTSGLLERPSSRAGTPSLRKSTERVRMGAPGSLLPSASGSPAPSPSRLTGPSASTPAPALTPSTSTSGTQDQSGPQSAQPAGWGWGGLWNTASAAIQQARTVVDEGVKNVQANEQAKKWGGGVIQYANKAQEYAKTANWQEVAKNAQEYAKNAQLDKISQDFKRVGLSTLTEILNVVAPPISEHEVLQVWLSHDMTGYEGIETIVYRGLAKIMEQVETGDLIVNRGNEVKPKQTEDTVRNLNSVEGFEAALKLAQAELAELMKREATPTPSKPAPTDVPVTYSHIYLRVQPFILPAPEGSTSGDTLHFLLHLSDPGHKLTHTTYSQAVPVAWIDAWEKYTWIEDTVVDALRLGVEVLGQEYVAARMAWIGGAENADTERKEGESEEESEEEESDEDEDEEPAPQTKQPQAKAPAAK